MLMLDEQKDITGVVVTRASTIRVIANRDIKNREDLAACLFGRWYSSRRLHS